MAFERLESAGAWTALVYDELKRLAFRSLRGQSRGHTLQPTALVHEAYLRLASVEDPPWRDRTHFLATAATTMRHVLVDHARARATEKRGGSRRRITLDERLGSAAVPDVDLLALHEAMERLAELDPRKARVVELRFFAGLDLEETATVLGVSSMTVSNDWRFARAWIARALGVGDDS
ncbi:MAG: ECF-type sigma factor [Planctomycetota bacterium]